VGLSVSLSVVFALSSAVVLALAIAAMVMAQPLLD